jgi:hypothetical protein
MKSFTEEEMQEFLRGDKDYTDYFENKEDSKKMLLDLLAGRDKMVMYNQESKEYKEFIQKIQAVKKGINEMKIKYKIEA